LRVISGSAKGVKLRSLPVPSLRPMLDRVKEALFNIIRGEVEGCQVLDLFSGSGGLGIEALSRGAASCLFVEQDKKLADLVSQNLERCRLSEKAVLLVADFFALPSLPRPQSVLPAGLVFADPPYEIVRDPNARQRLFETLEALVPSWIAPQALLVLHHSPLPHAIWPTTLFENIDRRVYGRSQLSFFRVVEEQKHA